jgi:glutaredoxin
MLSQITEKLRAFAYRQIEGDGSGKSHPMVQHARNLASIVNELLGQPLRPADAGQAAAGSAGSPANTNGTSHATPAVFVKPLAVRQAPVIVYFDGKDHRTRVKVEELLRGRDIAFQVLDVTDDEAERSWVTTAAKMTEFPIVVVAGTPVGGLAELTQLDLSGDLVRRVFAPN